MDPAAGAALDHREAGIVNWVWNDSRGGAGIDCDCPTLEDSIIPALRVARPAGRGVIAGVPSEQRPGIEHPGTAPANWAYSPFRGSCLQPPARTETLSAHPGAFARTITRRRPLAGIQGVDGTIEKREDGIAKALL